MIFPLFGYGTVKTKRQNVTLKNMLNNTLRARKNYKTRRKNPYKRDFVQIYRFSYENVKWLSEYFLRISNESRGGALDSFSLDFSEYA